VGVFRPARKVTDPNGRDWEIYVSRSELPKWRPAGGDYDNTVSSWWWLEPLAHTILLLPLFLLYQIVVPLVRALAELPGIIVRGRRSGIRIVEAISFWPVKETYTWTTTGDHVERVVDQVARGLEQGEFAHPLGATFRGSR
jgi:hypothetical protein